MFNRLAPLWPGFRFLGLVVLIWTMLAHASTAQFTLNLVTSISKWLGQNAWFGFAFGFALLALAVSWPDIEEKLPVWLKIPQTPGARLNAIEVEYIPELRRQDSDLGKRLVVLRQECETAASEARSARDELKLALDLQNQITESLTALSDNSSSRIHTLEEDRTKAISERSALNTRIADADRRVNAITDAFYVTPRFIAQWVDFTVLLWEAEDAIEVFLQMRNMYGATAPMVSEPFSSWRTKNHLGELSPDILEGEKWARSLERHVNHVNVFYLTRHLPLPGCSTGHLFTLINSWAVNRNQTSGESLLGLLRDHLKELVMMRRDYAASIAKGALANSEIS